MSTTLLILALFLAGLVGTALWLRQEVSRLSAAALTSGRQQFQEHADASFGLAQERVQNRLDLANQEMLAIVGPLKDQVLALSNQQIELGTKVTGLGDQTSALTQVLGAQPARGQWGEDNLRRIVHLAGLTEGIHVEVQPTFKVDGQTVRPDLLVHLAANEIVLVDAKAPMDAFQKAVNAQTREDIARWGNEHAVALKKTSVTSARSRTPRLCLTPWTSSSCTSPTRVRLISPISTTMTSSNWPPPTRCTSPRLIP